MCREQISAYIHECQEVFEYEDPRGGGVSIAMGPNYCPAALLYHPLGYTAVVSRLGPDMLACCRLFFCFSQQLTGFVTDCLPTAATS